MIDAQKLLAENRTLRAQLAYQKDMTRALERDIAELKAGRGLPETQERATDPRCDFRRRERRG